MRARLLGIGILLCGLSVAAAQEPSPYEKTLQKVIDGFEKIGGALKTIVDEDSAAAAKPDLRKAAAVVVDARADAAKLQPPEKDEKLRLEKNYKPKLEAAMKKMFTEVTRVSSVRGGKDALKELDIVLKKNSK